MSAAGVFLLAALLLGLAADQRGLWLLPGPPPGLPDLKPLRRHMSYPEPAEWCITAMGDTQFRPELAGPVLAAMQRERPYLMFQLGDEVLHGQAEEYVRYLAAVGSAWNGTPFFVIPGSHDRASDGLFWSTTRFEQWVNRRYSAVTVGRWTFVLLDTSASWLDGEQREWIARELRRLGPEQQLIVVNHMPPVDPRPGRRPHGMGPLGLAQLRNLLSGYDVRLFLDGHIHGQCETRWEGVPVLITAQDRDTWTGPTEPAWYVVVRVHGDRLSWSWRSVPPAPGGAP